MSKHVKVKPLEWLQISDTQWYANTICDPYFVRRLGEEWVWNLYGYPISESATKTLKEAQDAAQSDYESRILSALEPSPAFEAMVEALVEALEECDEADDIWLRMRAIEETRPGKGHGIAIDDDDYAKAWRDLHRLREDIWERRYAALALARGERS